MKNIIFFTLTLTLTAATASAQDTFSYKVGSNEIILLSEGGGPGNPSILIDPDPAIVGKYMPDGTYTTATNAFLVKRHGKNTLIDTGYGRNLLDNLNSVGVEPDDIHEIVLTHMHGDHIGGLLKDGVKTFPNAKLVIGRMEHDYWISDAEMNKLPENRRGSFRNAQEVIRKYGDNLELVDATDIAAVPAKCGIYPVAAYGHTPGHIGFMVVCGGNKLFVWGDLTHAMAVQMPAPGIAVTYDVDPDTAVASRLAILKYVSENKIPIAGMHIAYPGIGTVSAAGKGYEFKPAE